MKLTPKRVLYLVCTWFLILGGLTAQADDGLHHESQFGAAMVSGNTVSDTYNAQQTTTYSFELNLFKLSARYLEASANGTESARNWDGALRYERSLSEAVSAFASHSLESDVFAGFVQRNNFDLGGKYFFAKSVPTTWFGEFGYRYMFTHYPASLPDTVNNAVRVYSEINQVVSDTASFRFWIEYVPSFTNGQDYLINTEPSLSVMLNKVFSLKSAYLFKYRNFIPVGSLFTKNLDSVFTTSMVAKF